MEGRQATGGGWARLVFGVLLVGLVAYLNARFVLVHFSIGGDLLDSGWFAAIMASGDPWLTSPRSVGELSYFNYHLSPYLSALSVLFHALGADGFIALAVHQGLAFGLLAASLCAILMRGWSGWRSGVLLLAAMLLLLVGDVVLQIASFPHFEVATLAFCTLGAALWQRGHLVSAGLAFLLACTVREDGGFYAAAFLLALTLFDAGTPVWRRPGLWLAASAAAVSVVMFYVKGRYFPGFPTFAWNFEGDHWDHLTAGFLRGRLLAFATDPHAATALLPALLLALFSRRYLLFPLLMLPIMVAQLLAVRDELGHFTAYYALPFLLIWVGLFIVAAGRLANGRLAWPEPLLLLLFAIAGSGPLLFTLAPPAWFPVFTNAAATDIADLPLLALETASAVEGTPGACVSTGVAAIAPDAADVGHVITPETGIGECRTVFLFRTDLHYETLRPLLAGFTAGPVLQGRIERYDRGP